MCTPIVQSWCIYGSATRDLRSELYLYGINHRADDVTATLSDHDVPFRFRDQVRGESTTLRNSKHNQSSAWPLPEALGYRGQKPKPNELLPRLLRSRSRTSTSRTTSLA